MLLATMTGCSKEEAQEPPTDSQQKVEIRVGSNVLSMPQERSVITEGQYLTTMLIGREGANGYTGATPAWTASGSFYANATTGQEVNIAPKQYYNDAENTHTYMLGIYPPGTLQGNKVLFTRTDGEQDILFSQWVDAGTRLSASSAPSLDFEHKTAQIYFVAQAAPNSEGDLFQQPTFVENLTLRNVQVPVKVEIQTPELEFSEPTNLVAPGIPSVDLTDRPTVCGRPVMVNESAQIIIDITLNMGGTPIAFTGVILKDELNPEANLVTKTGKRHKVTLTFTAPEDDPSGSVKVNATATVKNWEDGSSGSVIL